MSSSQNNNNTLGSDSDLPNMNSPLLSSVNDIPLLREREDTAPVQNIFCWKNPPNKIRKCWRKVNTKTVAGGIILFFLLVSLLIFAAISEQPEDIHLMALSSDTPLVIPITLKNPERRTVLEVLSRIQNIQTSFTENSFPNPTLFVINLEGSNNGQDWVSSQPPLTLTAVPDMPNEEDTHDFFLNDFERYEEYRFLLSTNSDQPISITFRYKQITELVRYQVIIGLLILLVVYVVIVFELMHRTIIALIGSFLAVSAVSLIHGRPSFIAIINWIDFDTVGLLFGMMVMVGIFSDTGFFEFSAIKAYKLSKGNLWHLTVILCIFTAVASAFLDNVTTILLLAPVTIRLCKVLDVPPEPILLAEVMMSNIGGTSTAIGDPPNIIIINDPDIIQSGEITFFTFSLHVAPGVFFAAIASFIVIYFLNRSINRRPHQGKVKEISIWRHTANMIHETDGDEERKVKHHLLAYIQSLEEEIKSQPAENTVIDISELEEKYRIYDIPLFISSTIVLTCVIIMFFMHSWIHDYFDLSLAWIAIIGAMVHLLVSGISDIEQVLEKVELGTLLFFAGLFVLMHGLELLGVIEFVGDTLSSIIEAVDPKFRLSVAVLLIIWVSAFVSAFIDNIPYTTAMVPVIVSLANNDELDLPLTVLTWALSYGTCLGGNGTLIGASANVVACGLAEQQGYPISFVKFFKMGFPVMLVSVATVTVYMMISHVLIPWY